MWCDRKRRIWMEVMLNSFRAPESRPSHGRREAVGIRRWEIVRFWHRHHPIRAKQQGPIAGSAVRTFESTGSHR